MNYEKFNSLNIPITKFNTYEEVCEYVNEYSNFSKPAIRYVNDIKNYIVSTCIHDGNFYSYHCYNHNNALWEQMNESAFVTFTMFYNSELRKSATDIVNNLKFVKPDKNLNQVLNDLTKMTKITQLVQLVKSMLNNQEFSKKIDKHRNCLPIANNMMIEFDTLEVRPRVKEDYCSFTFNHEFLGTDHELPNANKFYSQIMPDPDCRDYLQQVLGNMLLSEHRINKFFVWYGHGANGKSGVFEIIAKILGTYFGAASKSIFIDTGGRRSGSDHSTDVYAIINKKAVTYSEGESADDINLNIALLKQLTGSDAISCRTLYKEPIDFINTCTLNLLTNFTVGASQEKAIVRRLSYIFMDSNFGDIHDPANNKYLIDKDFVENCTTIFLNEFFTWIAIGAKKLYDTNFKLVEPDKFIYRTSKLYMEEDSIASYMNNKLIKTSSESDKILFKDIYQDYIAYCDVVGAKYKKRSHLTDRLKEVYSTALIHGYSCFTNVKIKSPVKNEINIDDAKYKLAYKDLFRKHTDIQKKLISAQKELIICKMKLANKQLRLFNTADEIIISDKQFLIENNITPEESDDEDDISIDEDLRNILS